MSTTRVNVKSMRSTLRSFADSVRRDLIRAERESIREAQRLAKTQSQGPYSLEQLAAMGHPYAVRHIGQPGFAQSSTGQPTYILNKQTGEFYRNWKIQSTTSGSKIVNVLYNNTWYARFFGGTSRMIARPIEAAITAQIESSRLARVQAVLDKWF